MTQTSSKPIRVLCRDVRQTEADLTCQHAGAKVIQTVVELDT